MSGEFRFIHMADVHLNTAPTVPKWRVKEQSECLHAVTQYALDNKILDVMVAGDVFDHHNPDSATLRFFLWWINELVRSKIRVWIVPGNHDASDHMCKVHSMTSIRHTLNIVDADFLKGFNIIDRPHCLHGDPIKGFKVYFLPWLEEKEYLNSVKRISKTATQSQETTVLVTHAFIKGSQIGDGGYKHQEGIPLKAFDAFNYVALGDIHLRQEFRTKSGMAVYPGSLFCQNYGERKEKKGFLDVTVDALDSTVQFVPAPHVIWTQRKIKASVLAKVVQSRELFKRKFPKKKFKGKCLKLIIDCEGGKSSSQPLDELSQRAKDLELCSFDYKLTNTGYTRLKRFKSRKTDEMMDEMVDSDETVKKKRKSKTKKVGKRLLQKEQKDA